MEEVPLGFYRQWFAEMPEDAQVTAGELARLFSRYAPLFGSKRQERAFKRQIKKAFKL